MILSLTVTRMMKAQRVIFQDLTAPCSLTRGASTEFGYFPLDSKALKLFLYLVCCHNFQGTVLGDKVVAATWSELGQVHVWDITSSLKKLEAIGPNDPVLMERLGIKDQPKPLYTFCGHQGEGFAMDWSHTVKGIKSILCALTPLEFGLPQECLPLVIAQKIFTSGPPKRMAMVGLLIKDRSLVMQLPSRTFSGHRMKKTFWPLAQLTAG